MRMHKASQHRRVMPENTIPLINIVFLMLIFFLIAGTVAPPVSSSLTPPDAEDLPSMPPAGNAVEILADGTLIHHGVEMTLEEIVAQFPAPVATITTGEGSDAPEVAAADADANANAEAAGVLHILADKQLPAETLMPVLQAFRAAGHKTIRLVTLRGD